MLASSSPAIASVPTFLVSSTRCPSPCRGDGGECTYRVAWSINPHMRVGSVDTQRASQQHEAFVRTLRTLGAEVLRVPFVHAAYDSVFAKDSAILVRRAHRTEALMTRLRYPERQQEQEQRASSLQALGFHVAEPIAEHLEGGDVVLRPAAAGAFLGYGFRSDHAAASRLERFLEQPVTPLELRLSELYHLDMALSIVDERTVLVCNEALTRQSQQRLQAEVGSAAIVPVSLEEALSFALNVVVVGNDIVKAQAHPRLDNLLRRRGYSVRLSPLGEFHRAGGSAACLVSRVHPLGEDGAPAQLRAS